MISKKYIKDLDFETIEDIYNYIVDSFYNGNYSQSKNLIKKLSDDQLINFIDHIEYILYENKDDYIKFIKIGVLK